MIYVVGEDLGSLSAHGTAARLARLCGVPEAELLARVAWLNLFATPTPAALVGLVERAAGPGDAVVLMGRRVARAWGLGDLPPLGEVRRAHGTLVLLLPHPSGRNRWWNDPARLEAGREAMRRVWLGHYLDVGVRRLEDAS